MLLGEKRGLELGEKRGLELGEKRGLELGEKRAKEMVALQLLSMKMSIDEIMKATGLSKTDIQKLKQ